MEILDQIIRELKPAKLIDVRIGLHWIGVTVQTGDQKRCGLASTVPASHSHHDGFDVPEAGDLLSMNALDLARWADSDHPIRAGLGLATINAILEPCEELWQDINAEHVIARFGENERVGLVGRFPFINRLRDKVKQLYVFEQDPHPGEFSPAQMKDILPDCKVVAITGMTLVNHTFEEVFSHRSKGSISLLMGPTTPVTPLFFDYGLDLISGAVVDNIDAVSRCLIQGASFRQIHKAGTRLVTIQSPRLKD